MKPRDWPPQNTLRRSERPPLQPANLVNLTARRQLRCAQTPEGHRFDGTTCSRCGLTVTPRLRPVP